MDKRRFLVASEIVITAIAAINAVPVWLDLISPTILLFFTFLVGAGAAITAPAWQPIVPQLVPKQDLAAAVASDGVGANIKRAIGPALGAKRCRHRCSGDRGAVLDQRTEQFLAS